MGAKFSPTWEVEGELDLLIRKSAPPLGKRVRRGVVHARSSSSAARSLDCCKDIEALEEGG